MMNKMKEDATKRIYEYLANEQWRQTPALYLHSSTDRLPKLTHAVTSMIYLVRGLERTLRLWMLRIEPFLDPEY
jgi:hypothetical protein